MCPQHSLQWGVGYENEEQYLTPYEFVVDIGGFGAEEQGLVILNQPMDLYGGTAESNDVTPSMTQRWMMDSDGFIVSKFNENEEEWVLGLNPKSKSKKVYDGVELVLVQKQSLLGLRFRFKSIFANEDDENEDDYDDDVEEEKEEENKTKPPVQKPVVKTQPHPVHKVDRPPITSRSPKTGNRDELDDVEPINPIRSVVNWIWKVKQALTPIRQDTPARRHVATPKSSTQLQNRLQDSQSVRKQNNVTPKTSNPKTPTNNQSNSSNKHSQSGNTRDKSVNNILTSPHVAESDQIFGDIGDIMKGIKSPASTKQTSPKKSARPTDVLAMDFESSYEDDDDFNYMADFSSYKAPTAADLNGTNL